MCNYAQLLSKLPKMFQLHYSASIIWSRKDTQVSDPKSADNILKAISESLRTTPAKYKRSPLTLIRAGKVIMPVQC